MTDLFLSSRDTRIETFLDGKEVAIDSLHDGDEVAVRFITGESGLSNYRVDYIPRATVTKTESGVRFLVQLNIDMWTDLERKLYFGSSK